MNNEPPILEHQPRRPIPLRTRVGFALGAAGVAVVVGGIVYQPQQARPIPLPGSPAPLQPVWQPSPQPTGNPSPATKPAGEAP